MRKHRSGRRPRARASAGAPALPWGLVGQPAAVAAVLRPVPCASPGSAGPPPPSSLPLRPRRAGREATLAGSPGGKGSPEERGRSGLPSPGRGPGGHVLPLAIRKGFSSGPSLWPSLATASVVVVFLVSI